MAELSAGDIVLISFSFTDLTSSKLRPAVIISNEEVHRKEDDYTLLFISSVIPTQIQPHEVLFPTTHSDFQESGLKKESLFKANKIATIQKKLLKRRIGKLGAQIRNDLREAFHRAIVL